MRKAKHTMIVYGIKNCDTVKKVMTFLDDNAIAYSFMDLKKEIIPSDILKHWATLLGASVLVNTKSATYRRLSDDEKQGLSIDTCADIIAQNQSIMKRPIILYANGDITVGFNDTIKGKINA